MEKWQIENAGPTDLERLVALDAEIYGAGSFSSIVWRQYLDICAPTFLLARTARCDIAYAVVAPTWRRGESWFLSLAVLQGYRKLGVGRTLAEEALKQAIALESKFMYLTVSRLNVAARSLYQSIGFEEIRFEPNYYGTGEDRVVMRWSGPSPWKVHNDS